MKIIQFYYENLQSAAAAARKMRGKYDKFGAPSEASVKRIISKFLETANASADVSKGKERGKQLQQVKTSKKFENTSSRSHQHQQEEHLKSSAYLAPPYKEF